MLISPVQADLFSDQTETAAPTVPGFSLQPDYINPNEERALIAHVDAGQWNTDWRRRVQRYGLGYGAADMDTTRTSRILTSRLLPRMLISDFRNGITAL